MTDERKNEIWAMLPADFKELVTKTYKTGVPYDAFKYHRRAPEYCNQAKGGLYMLEFLFGSHNLTAQADETTPKSPSHCENEPNLGVSERETTRKSPSEPKFKVGEKVFVKTSKNLSPRDIDLFRRNPSYVQGVSDKGMVTVAIVERHSVTIPIEDIVPWVDGASADSVETSTNSQTNSQAVKKVDYSQYRLDLAKEIAVAMITSRNEPVLRSIAEVAVDTANEIVKRLKETEE